MNLAYKFSFPQIWVESYGSRGAVFDILITWIVENKLQANIDYGFVNNNGYSWIPSGITFYDSELATMFSLKFGIYAKSVHS